MALTAWETDARRAGRMEGIAGTIAILHDVGMADDEIRRRIMKQYKLTDEQADRYMQAPAEAVEASA